jgi:RNA polymerase sigma-70 factor (ECF subfamily)
VNGENGGVDPESAEGFLATLRSGDHTAFAILVERHQDMVYNLALRMVKDRELAEDLSQETFVKVYRGLPSFKGHSSLSTWIFRIAYNVAVTELEKARHRYEAVALEEVESGMEPHGAGAGEPGGPLEEMERTEMVRIVERLIEKLDPQKRSVLTLYYQGGRSYKEICDIMEIPMGTVKTLLFRAKEELRDLYGKEGSK